MSGPSLPTPEQLRSALDRLEAFAGHVGTLALHDPLYFLLSESDPAHLAALEAALLRHPEHPLAPRLRADFSPWMAAVPEDTLEGVLHEAGPWDPTLRPPLEEVRWRLRRAQEVRQILETRIQGLEQAVHEAARTANSMAAVAALVSVVALLGWLAALGVWRIPWLEPLPTPESLQKPADTPARTAPGDAP